MEYFDVLDENGNKTGEVINRDVVHAKGLWHKSVHVWIIREDKQASKQASKQEILLQKRAPNKKVYPNLWDISSAGHLAAGETPTGGAIREINEEIGINVLEKDLEFLFTSKESFVYKDVINKEFDDVYLLKLDIDINDLTFKDGEVAEVKWIDFADFVEMVNSQSPELVPNWNLYDKLCKVLNDRFDRGLL